MNNRTVKKAAAIGINVALALCFVLLLVKLPEQVLLTTVVMWLFAAALIGSLLYFLYWLPKQDRQTATQQNACSAPSEAPAH